MTNINIKIPENGDVLLPTNDPLSGTQLKYFRESDKVPLIPMKLSVMNTIESPPITNEQLFTQAASGDGVTINTWEQVWIDEYKRNRKSFDVNDMSVMALHGKEAYKPIILAGSGSSLKKNFQKLRAHKIQRHNPVTHEVEDSIGGGRGGIRVVSALHNFGLFENHDIMGEDDYYVTLDAGKITLPEMIEGGQGAHDEEWYWERTKNRTLISTVYGNNELLTKWRGKIYFFHQSWNSEKIKNEVFTGSEGVDIHKVPAFSTGGNVLGACQYFARAVLGAGVNIFIGADFSFSYDHKFHGWDSGYDAQFAGLIPAVDIFGNRVYTWPSYYNFKCFFDFVACGGSAGQHQVTINATEGGIFGAYQQGCIKQVIQMDLENALKTFTLYGHLPGYLAGDTPVVLY